MLRSQFFILRNQSALWEIAEILEQEGAHCLRSEKSLPVKQINYILRNEVYVGDRKLQKKNPKNYLTKKPDANIEKKSYYLKDIHEGIVDRTLWERVQAQLGKAEAARMEERDAGILRKRRSGHFLTGMLFCEKCGTVYCRRTFQKKGEGWRKDQLPCMEVQGANEEGSKSLRAQRFSTLFFSHRA